jgi:hypothetical protein
MLPSHLDGGFHSVGQDDKLGWSAVVMGAKAHDVDLSHSGRKIPRKLGESKGSRDNAYRGIPFEIHTDRTTNKAIAANRGENRKATYRASLKNFSF